MPKLQHNLPPSLPATLCAHPVFACPLAVKTLQPTLPTRPPKIHDSFPQKHKNFNPPNFCEQKCVLLQVHILHHSPSRIQSLQCVKTSPQLVLLGS